MDIAPRHLNQFSPAMRKQIGSAITHALAKTHRQDTRILNILPMSGYYTSIVFGVELQYANSSGGNDWLYFKLANTNIDNQKALIEQEFHNSQQAAEYFKQKPGLHAIEPLAWLDEDQGFVMNPMPGDRLDKFLIRRMRPFIPSHCSQDTLRKGFRLAGSWLHEYQLVTEVTEKSTPEHNQGLVDISDYHRRIENLLLSFHNEAPGYLQPMEVEQIYQQSLEDLQRFTDKELRLVTKHNDFAPWNMNLIPGTGRHQAPELMVFDFADVKADCFLYDIYHFIRSVHLYKFKLLTNSKILPFLVEAFIEGFGLQPEELSPHTARFFNLYFNLSSTFNLLRSQLKQTGLKGYSKKLAFHRYLTGYKAERHNILR